MKLSDKQIQRLLQFGAAQSVENPLGYMSSVTDRSLLKLGLIEVEETRMRFGGPGAIGRAMMTVKVGKLTPAGHRYLGDCGFAPFPNEERFLGKRRVGYCAEHYLPFIACLAKGWVEITERTIQPQDWVKWKKTKAGRDAMKIERSPEEINLINSVMPNE
jgi:hypothetical protein